MATFSGCILATALAAVMMENPAFHANFAAVKTELRSARDLAHSPWANHSETAK
jgi:hypothetical protein